MNSDCSLDSIIDVRLHQYLMVLLEGKANASLQLVSIGHLGNTFTTRSTVWLYNAGELKHLLNLRKQFLCGHFSVRYQVRTNGWQALGLKYLNTLMLVETKSEKYQLHNMHHFFLIFSPLSSTFCVYEAL